MNIKFGHWKTFSAIAASTVLLAACGGGDEPAAKPAAPAKAAAAAVDTAAAEAKKAAEMAAAEAKETAEKAAAAAEEAAKDAAETVTEAAQGAADTVTAAVADDRVPAASIAAYAALTGDAGNGRRVFTKCMSCHVVKEGQNRSGPSLYKVVGRTAGTVENFRYSSANAGSGVTWTEEALFTYLENPRAFIPGTIMAFPGLPKAQDRADVIAYLIAESS